MREAPARAATRSPGFDLSCLLEGHQQHAAVAKADYLGANYMSGFGLNFAKLSDRRGGSIRCHQQPHRVPHLVGSSCIR